MDADKGFIVIADRFLGPRILAFFTEDHEDAAIAVAALPDANGVAEERFVIPAIRPRSDPPVAHAEARDEDAK